MTSTRSLAASVAALGFASTLGVALPAYGTAARKAATPCERAERYAAQAEAEFLRIDRLDLGAVPKREHGAGITKRDTGERPSVAASDPAGAGEVLRKLDPESPAPSAGDQDEDESDESDTDSPSTDESDPPTIKGSAPDRTTTDGREAKSTGLLSGVGDLLGGLVPAAHRVGGAVAAGGFTAARRTGEALTASGLPAAARQNGDDDRAELGKPGAAATGEKNANPRVISGVGIGDARTVMIADAPTKSAAAGLLLDGRVAGAPAAEQVLRQAPPSHAAPLEQRTGPKRFGPIQIGAGAMSAHAAWTPAMGCAAADGETSRSVTRIDGMTLSDGLVRVPAKLSSLSTTALSGRGANALTVASATVSTGRIELAGGEVRIRVLRAPTLRVSMSAGHGGEVRYRPAVVEVSGPGISRTTLSTGSDHVDVTVSDNTKPTESSAVPVLPSRGSPLPSISGLPSPSGGGGGAARPESAPADGKAVVRVSLGDVRQASKGHALAARATAIKVSVTRPAASGRGKEGYGSSGVVAELGIGVLEAAAVAPDRGDRAVESGVHGGTLPVTGPGVAPMFVTGAGLLAGGFCAFYFSTRRRRDS